MEHVNEMMKVVSETLSEAGSCDIAIGEPMTLGKYQILVLTRTSVGFGAGGGQGEGLSPAHPAHHRKGSAPMPPMKGKGTGVGAGGAVKVRPVGVIAIGPDGVQVLSIPEKPGMLDKLFEKIPALVERLAPMMPQKPAACG